MTDVSKLEVDAPLPWERVEPILRLARSIHRIEAPLCPTHHDIYIEGNAVYCKNCAYEKALIWHTTDYLVRNQKPD